MKLREHPLRLLVPILLVALSTRVGFVYWWQFHHLPAQQRFEFPDSESYWILGQQIAQGEPYEFGSPDRRAFRAPGYPILLAALFKLTGVDASPLAARILGACIGTLSVGLVYWCARPVFGSTAGLWGAAMMAVDPGAIATSGFVLAEAPFGMWMLLQLGLWQRGEILAENRGQSALLTLLSGIAAGIATLTRPSWLLFTPLLIAACRLSAGPSRGWLLRSGCALLGLVIALTPWTVRNWRVFHQFIPTSLQVGASLYDGLHPESDGGSDMRFVDRFTAELKAADAQQPDAAVNDVPFEIRLDRRMRDAALAWARENPGRALQLATIKFSRMWNPWPNEPSFRRWYVAVPVAVSYITVIGLAILGTWRHRTQGWRMALFWLPALYFTLLHMVFVGSIRYRQPAMLALAVPAGAAIVGPLSIARSPLQKRPSLNS
ncbi:MAG: glycosyltransferase family 39 protein [Pirellulales bacterium]